MLPDSVYNDCEKSFAKYLEYKETGNELFKKLKYEDALISYTKGLIYAPVAGLENVKENPVAILFSNRSAACYRLRNYKQCVRDVNYAFKNGNPNNKKYFKLINRLAWSYWHLKKFSKCQQTLKEMNGTEGCKTNFHKEIVVLQNLLEKLDKNEILKSEENQHPCQIEKNFFASNENSLIKGATSSVEIFSTPDKGRHLKAVENLMQGDLVIKEKSYCGILNVEFIDTHCNYCYKDCRLNGIPCFGCTSSLYCDGICKNLAWKKYHWLECSVWPIIGKMDIFSILSLRIVLQAAYDISQETDFDEVENVIMFISNQIRTMKSSCHINSMNERSETYKGEYIRIFNLLTHSNDVDLKTRTNSFQLAQYLATVMTSCLEKYDNKFKNGKDNSVEVQLKSCFENLSLKFWLATKDFEIEEMRRYFSIACNDADAKEFNSNIHNEIPSSFNEMLTYLLNHHTLQLLTNSQAIFQTVEEMGASHSTNITQKRIATAVFPTLSLLNHSCDPNTVVNFHGNTVNVKVTSKLKKGDEILHCYGPCVSRHSFEQRRAMLKSQYYFTCDCSACHGSNIGDSDLQAFQQQFTAYKCTHCSGPCVITESNSNNDLKIAGKCLDTKCKKLNDLTQSDKEFHELMNTITEVGRRNINSDNATECLSTLLSCLGDGKKLLYHNHRAIGSIHDLIAFCYIENEQYKEAIPHIQQSIKIICMRFGSQSIEAAREFFKLTTLQVYVCDYKQANFYLKKCLPTLRLNLNKQSTEWKEAVKMERRIKCGMKLNLIN